jgi:uncharacterized protein YgbK (DUF1537 family)
LPRATETPIAELLEGLPPVWPHPLLARIRRSSRDRTLVVLDDDPTGTQTVRDVEVLIDPSTDALARVLASHPRVVFVLTNSRSLPRDRAVTLARRLGRRIALAARIAKRDLSLVSRSDSTLRGHYPAEVDALAEGAGVAAAPVLFMPYLGEAGRLTRDDVHYVVRDGTAVPVAETEFARDAAFGYRESNLRDWLAIRGANAAHRPIESLSLESIRTLGPDGVSAAIRRVAPRTVIVANAVDDGDAEVIAAGVVAVEQERPILGRTAAGYVRARSGQPRAPLLGAGELRVGPGPGLVIVGSHVPTTTRQMDVLLSDPPGPIEHVEVDAADAANPRRRRAVVRAAVARAADALARGAVPVVATSRQLLAPSAADPTGLRLARRVSTTLAAIVRELEPRPGWIIAKGGITSSDVASRGLRAAAATVVGPLLEGVPVWRVPRPGRRSLLLVVFPGNVGDDQALRSAVARLTASGRVGLRESEG